MSTCISRSWVGALLLGPLSGCGGIATDVPADGGNGIVGVGAGSGVPDGASSSGSGGSVGPYDSGTQLDASPAGDAGSPFDAGSGGTSGGDGGTCSMPVGSLAPGCPMLLTPLCPWKVGGVIFDTLQCELPFAFDPTTDPEVLSYVDVQFGTSWETAPRLLRVAGPEDCNKTGNGWYFDDPKLPTKIHVCPNACACAKTQPGKFHLAQGCWTNAAPGVLDAEIPCPHCPKTRPKSCGKQSGGYSPGIVKCEMELLPGYDPAFTNVYYWQHGAVAGLPEPWDGYLTFVPSLADCDKVEEGWTLDSSTTPATIVVCPSACSCAKVSGASLMVEGGCPRNEWKGP